MLVMTTSFSFITETKMLFARLTTEHAFKHRTRSFCLRFIVLIIICLLAQRSGNAKVDDHTVNKPGGSAAAATEQVLDTGSATPGRDLQHYEKIDQAAFATSVF